MKKIFIVAIEGIIHCFKTELNFRIHVFAALTAIGLGWIFKISSMEWLVIILCCMIVISLELINSAIEHLCDLVSTEFHPVIKIIKDMSAGAVLISAIGSLVVGLVIFGPAIFYQIKTWL